MPVAWVLGPSGTWGQAFASELLGRGFDVSGFGPRDVPELAAEALGQGRGWTFVQLDLSAFDASAAQDLVAKPPGGLPDVVVDAALAHDGDRAALVAANFVAKAALVEALATAMAARGSGRIGVLVPQNARFGLAGLGDLAAPQAALWTWAEALDDELRAAGGAVSLTIVIPPHAASDTQRLVVQRSGHAAAVHPPEARPLVDGILRGRRRAGRRPVLAALALLR
jgi:NAD(P)-dependent dehydrogenase (short-subunit alcohol dehydrogenase family)